MILGRFPWVWSPAVATAPPPPPPPPPFWSKDVPGTMAWHTQAAQVLPRFQHLYPQDSTIRWVKKDSV